MTIRLFSSLNKEDTMSKKNYHVVKDKDGDWKVKKEGGKRASSSHGTKKDAVDSGRNLAKKAGGELSIHKEDGKIGKKHSYGNDPNPPKG
jgi:uncharacterized protein YdaT